MSAPADRAAVEQQVRRILAAGRGSALRKDTLLLAVHCDATATLLAEVIRTCHGPAVVTYHARGGVKRVEPLADDPRHEYPLTKTSGTQFDPITAGVLASAIANDTKRLLLALPTAENTASVVRGSSPEAAAKAQVSRARAAVRYRREHNHPPAEIAGTEAYLAAAEANLAEIRRRSRKHMSR